MARSSLVFASFVLVVAANRVEGLVFITQTANVGETVTLRCNTTTTKKDVIWDRLYYDSSNQLRAVKISINGLIVDTSSKRYTVGTDYDSYYNLIFRDVQLADAKTYICSESGDDSVLIAEGLIVKLEVKTGCTSNQFSCLNGRCVPLEHKCDGDNDCLDNSDEDGCTSCAECHFRCANGRCVHVHNLCNGVDDCRDNSDELDCADQASLPLPLLQHNFVLVTDMCLKNVYQVDMTRGTTRQLLSYSALSKPSGLAFDSTARNIYWADASLNTINKYSMTNHNTTTIYADTTNTALFNGIAIDASKQKIYYADTGNGRIGELSMDGTSHRVILTDPGSKPRALLLDSDYSTLYWTDWCETRPGIYRSPTKTGQKTAIITTKLVSPNALAIDFEEPLSQSYYFGMALDSTYLYFTDWRNTAIRKMNRQTLKTYTVASSVSFYRPSDIIVYNKWS